ncbi:MAG: AIR synthase family protein [Christensenellales bacterium]|jgi:hydrogenase expression/formation protein HypE
MRLGKLSNEQLKKLVLDRFHRTRSEVVAGSAVGEDCAAIDLQGELCVLSTDPITAATGNIGALAVHVCCNDAAACGAEPVGLLVTMLLPPDTTEEYISSLAAEVSDAAIHCGVDVLGGHTEITDAVTRPVISASVVAKVPKNALVTTSGMRPGDDIVMTKWAGLEGTAILATDHRQKLVHVWNEPEFAEARALSTQFSVTRESRIACTVGGVTAMHDATEGGILGAIWEMADASGCGASIDENAIPVLGITKKACAALDLDPLRMISSGVLLIASERGELLCATLNAAGIPAAVIGKAVKEGVALNGTPIAPPEGDELLKLL